LDPESEFKPRFGIGALDSDSEDYRKCQSRKIVTLLFQAKNTAVLVRKKYFGVKNSNEK